MSTSKRNKKHTQKGSDRQQSPDKGSKKFYKWEKASKGAKKTASTNQKAPPLSKQQKGDIQHYAMLFTSFWRGNLSDVSSAREYTGNFFALHEKFWQGFLADANSETPNASSSQEKTFLKGITDHLFFLFFLHLISEESISELVKKAVLPLKQEGVSDKLVNNLQGELIASLTKWADGIVHAEKVGPIESESELLEKCPSLIAWQKDKQIMIDNGDLRELVTIGKGGRKSKRREDVKDWLLRILEEGGIDTPPYLHTVRNINPFLAMSVERYREQLLPIKPVTHLRDKAKT